MPYIPKDEQEAIRNGINLRGLINTPGQLNFAINVLLIRYLHGTTMTYQLLNDCVGALEGAKLEFTRRVVVPYENHKRDENGDIYPLTLGE